MDLQKLTVKIFVEPPNVIPLSDFIDVFHGWIQASDGAYHDIADYSHIQAGPGIVLIANDANVSIDETGNRRGLLYNRKSWLEGSNRKKLRSVLRAARANCRRLEEEPALRGRLRFVRNEVAISVNARGIAPNSSHAFEELKADVASMARDSLGSGQITLEYDDDPRRRLSVLLRSTSDLWAGWSRGDGGV